MITGKIWGTTEIMLRTPLLELHRLYVKPHSRCSMHRHQFKWNGFFVQEGTLLIEVQKNDYSLIDVTMLSAGEFTTVKPGEYHRFMSTEKSAKVLEIYYLEPISEDIERLDVGGLVSSHFEFEPEEEGIPL